MLENRAAVAAFVQVKCKPSHQNASAGCYEHFVASEKDKSRPAISNKFHSMLLLDITAACLASVASNVNASTASWSYLLLALFQRRRALNH